MTDKVAKNIVLTSKLAVFLWFFFAVINLANAQEANLKLRQADQSLAQYFEQHNSSSKQWLNHSIYGRILSKYVKPAAQGINLVAWSKFTNSDKEKLTKYLKSLQKIDPRILSQNEQLAYWVNLYNAATLHKVLLHYPVKSIKDIDTSPGWFADGPWGEKFLKVAGENISLDDIEHEIIRPIWKDKRIHYAVNCASIGCPNLGRFPYEGKKVLAQFDIAAKNFINSPRGLRIRDNKIVASKIWDWYSEDFVSKTKLVEHWLEYLNDGAVKQKLLSEIPSINYEYDWRLNEHQ